MKIYIIRIFSGVSKDNPQVNSLKTKKTIIQTAFQFQNVDLGYAGAELTGIKLNELQYSMHYFNNWCDLL